MMDINFGLEHEVVTNGGALPAMRRTVYFRLPRPPRWAAGLHADSPVLVAANCMGSTCDDFCHVPADDTDDSCRVETTVFELAGHDRPGIVADVAHLLTQNGCNVRSAAVRCFGVSLGIFAA